MTAIAISSGHGLHIRGARGNPVPPQLDEVDQARLVVADVAGYLRQMGVTVYGPFNDDISTTQSENLDRIVGWHNSQPAHDLDVSVHFNAYDGSAHGTEVLYVTQEDLAARVSAAMAQTAGFTNRGAKYRGDLAFLNGTHEPAVLLETCFCDNTGDSDLYRQHFDALCRTIAESLSGKTIGEQPPVGELPPYPPIYPVLRSSGTVSWFGGPEDEGVSADEGLAFIYHYSDAPYLFLPYQPEGTTGLARRLDSAEVNYIAMRWDYDVYPKEMLAFGRFLALVRAPSTGREYLAWPADWGPNEATGRVADISQGLMTTLGIETDDMVEVTFPSQARPSLPRPPQGDTPVVQVHVAANTPVTVRVSTGANVSQDGAST